MLIVEGIWLRIRIKEVESILSEVNWKKEYLPIWSYFSLQTLCTSILFNVITNDYKRRVNIFYQHEGTDNCIELKRWMIYDHIYWRNEGSSMNSRSYSRRYEKNGIRSVGRHKIYESNPRTYFHYTMSRRRMDVPLSSYWLLFRNFNITDFKPLVNSYVGFRIWLTRLRPFQNWCLNIKVDIYQYYPFPVVFLPEFIRFRYSVGNILKNLRNL